MSSKKLSSFAIFFCRIKYLCLIFILSLQCTSPTRPLIIGHRGAKGYIAENTLPSIAKAMELGVDGIEIDIFLCKSGELVVFHDKKLDRLTNNHGYIESLEYDSIKKISVLGGYKIPTIGEVLKLIDGKVFLNIELICKNTNADFFPKRRHFCRRFLRVEITSGCLFISRL